MAYQNYSQTDPRWAHQRLGTLDGIDLGMAGCYVTAFANVAEHFGKDVTPGQLDDIFTNNGFYVDGNLCTDDMLTKAFSDIQFYGVYHCEEVPCDLSVFNEFNNYEHEAIVELDASIAPGIQTHFCRFFDYDPMTGVVRIVDSQDGTIVSVADRYGMPQSVILKVVKYVGPSLFTAPAEVSPVVEETPTPVAPVETQPSSVSLPPVDAIQPPAPVLTEPAGVKDEPVPTPVVKPKKLRDYKKSIVAAIGTLLTGLNVLFGTNPWVQLLISAATLAGVYKASNGK